MSFNMGVDMIAKSIETFIKSVEQVIDEFHTSVEEKLKAKIQLYALANDTITTLLTYQMNITKYQAKIIIAEAIGHSWIQRNWRPITMLAFVFIIIYNHFFAPILGLISAPIPNDLWDVIKIGLGGYVMGRSVEKIAYKILHERGGINK